MTGCLLLIAAASLALLAGILAPTLTGLAILAWGVWAWTDRRRRP